MTTPFLRRSMGTTMDDRLLAAAVAAASRDSGTAAELQARNLEQMERALDALQDLAFDRGLESDRVLRGPGVAEVHAYRVWRADDCSSGTLWVVRVSIRN